MAVKKGLLKKHPCIECGSPNVDAHHNDYMRPLEIVWLCRKHHIELHKITKGCDGLFNRDGG